MHIINHISQIYLLNNKYFVIDYNNNEKIVLNIKKGKEENINNIKANNKKVIYQNGNDYQESFELSEIESITLRCNVELLNNTNQKTISSPCLIEIKDTENNSFFIDACLNQTYTRKNNYLLKLYCNSNEDYIFSLNKKIVPFNILIKLNICNLISPLLAIDEEDIV